MVEYKDILYIFGGELSFCNDQETPLWMFDIKVHRKCFEMFIFINTCRRTAGRSFPLLKVLLLQTDVETTLQLCFKTACTFMEDIKT